MERRAVFGLPGAPTGAGALALALGLASGLALAACGGADASGAGAAAGGQRRPVILATTTSTQDSGLLDVLVPAFEEETGYEVKTLAVGSGEALELGERGEADVVLAHAPAAEEALVATGKTGGRLLVMHNDFVLLGPASDPARVRGAASVGDAMRAIAAAEAPFVSRGDGSGTHELELRLWTFARVAPAGDWYHEAGQGMGATIRIASEQAGYTVSDRATFLQTKDGNDLEVLVEGDPALLNVYHVIPITRRAGERVNEEGGRVFAAWIVSPRAQSLIGAFGVEERGRALFVPDAGKDEAELGASG